MRWTHGWLEGALFGSILVFSNLALAAKKIKQIHWYLADVPAVHMAEGERKGKGFLDQVLYQQLIPSMPEYKHSVHQVPVARREGMLKTDPLACAPGLFKTAGRGDHIVYSSPYMVSLPPGVFSLSSKKDRIKKNLDKKSHLDLQKVLAEAQLAIGVVSGRSYGNHIDTLLTKYEGKSNIYRASSEHAIESLIKMLLSGRIDLVLANVYEPSFQNKVPGQESLGFVFWPVQEQSNYVLVYAACALSEDGKTAVQAIDSVLAKPEVRKSANQYFESWLRKSEAALAKTAQERAVRDGKIKN